MRPSLRKIALGTAAHAAASASATPAAEEHTPHRRRALRKWVLPLGIVGLAAAPALGSGTPVTFAPAVDYQLGFTGSWFPAVRDLNGDGHPDVVVGGDQTNAFAVLPGNGDGTLGAATTVSTTNPNAPNDAYNPRAVTPGDLNNDGLIDLYFAGYGINDNVVSLNQSSGATLAFGPASYIPARHAPGKPALGDLNEDGNLDVVQPSYNGNNGDADSVLFRLGNGDGTFGASSQLFTNPLPAAGSNAAAIADVNGDGHLDALATVNPPGGGTPQQAAVMTALGNGDGTFQMPATVSFTGANSDPNAILVLDVNGDGDLDVLTGNGSSVSIMLGDGTGSFATGTLNTDLVGYSLAAADLNGDGVTDLGTADWNGEAVNVALGNGDGTFEPASQVAMPAGSNPYGLALADLNGDGLGDMVVDFYNLQTVSVLLNTSVVPAPAVTAVTPASGSTSGGTSVTISGTAFTGATAVTFGGVNATSFTVNSPTSITAVAPAHAAGTVAIEVTTANGTGTGAGLFTYSAPPAPEPPPAPAPSPSPEAAPQPAAPSAPAPAPTVNQVTPPAVAPAGDNRTRLTFRLKLSQTGRYTFILQEGATPAPLSSRRAKRARLAKPAPPRVEFLAGSKIGDRTLTAPSSAPVLRGAKAGQDLTVVALINGTPPANLMLNAVAVNRTGGLQGSLFPVSS